MTTTSRSEPRWRRWALALLLVCGAQGCSSCGNDAAEPAPSAAVSTDLSPVPEPDGVVAEVLLAQPEQTWKRFRTVTGGVVNLLPQSYGVLVVTLVGLPPTSAGAFDADVPSVGVLVEGKPGELSYVMGFHVKSPRELIAALTAGSDARFSAKLDSASGVTLIDAKPGKGYGNQALGLVGNHVLVAREAEHLTRFGPFVARTLPKRTMPAEGLSAQISKKALAGPLAKAVRARWKAYASELEAQDRKNREKHGGRAPDFGDPLVALRGVGAAVDAVAAALESSKGGKLAVLPRDDRLEAKLEIEAEPGGKAAETIRDMAVGSLAPLLVLPNDVHFAIVNHTSAAGREESARSFADGAANLLGDRLSEAHKKKIQAVFSDLAKGRGDDASYGLYSKNDKTALVYRGSVADAKLFASGLAGLFGLLDLPAVKEPVRQFVGSISQKRGTVDVPGIEGKVQRYSFELAPSPINAGPQGAGGAVQVGPKRFELLWFIKDGVAYAALSSEASAALVDLATASGAATIAGNAPAKGMIDRSGGETTFAVYAQPTKIGIGSSQKSSAPLLVSVGRKGQSGWLRFDADRAAVQGLMQRFGRL